MALISYASFLAIGNHLAYLKSLRLDFKLWQSKFKMGFDMMLINASYMAFTMTKLGTHKHELKWKCGFSCKDEVHICNFWNVNVLNVHVMILKMQFQRNLNAKTLELVHKWISNVSPLVPTYDSDHSHQAVLICLNSSKILSNFFFLWVM
jgi:hypothetical protein